MYKYSIGKLLGSVASIESATVSPTENEVVVVLLFILKLFTVGGVGSPVPVTKPFAEVF